jgi:hypothetical protein
VHDLAGVGQFIGDGMRDALDPGFADALAFFSLPTRRGSA